jgi:hypothetical protein
MTTLEQGLVNRLRTDPSVQHYFAVATTPPAWRIYPEFLPQSVAYPALRYARISTEPLLTLNGPVMTREARYQIDVWDRRPDTAAAAAAAVRDSLQGLRNDLGGASIGYCWVEGYAQQSEPDAEGADYRVTMDLVIFLAD